MTLRSVNGNDEIIIEYPATTQFCKDERRFAGLLFMWRRFPQAPRQAGRTALRGHRCKERIGSRTHLPSRKSIGTMWRDVPGKPATPFEKNTRRGERGQAE